LPTFGRPTMPHLKPMEVDTRSLIGGEQTLHRGIERM
jgi:hypothetical protein